MLHREALFVNEWIKQNGFFKINQHEDGLCFFTALMDGLGEYSNKWKNVGELIKNLAQRTKKVFY